jgi:hypothetical protein
MGHLVTHNGSQVVSLVNPSVGHNTGGLDSLVNPRVKSFFKIYIFLIKNKNILRIFHKKKKRWQKMTLSYFKSHFCCNYTLL